jgi:hypothetical protein
MRRWQAVLATVTGFLIIAGAGAHGFLGWRAMRAALTSASVAPDLIGGIGAAWQFGTMAMIAFGLMLIAAGVKGFRSGDSGGVPLALIAVTYVGFGVATLAIDGYKPQWVVFLVLGAMTALCANPLSRR